MQYTVPLNLDNNNEPIGLLSLFTSEGPVVIIFTNRPRLEKFLAAAHAAMQRQGQKVGTTSFDAESMEEIVGKLLDMDPTLVGTQFVPDSAGIYDVALDMLRADSQ